MTAECILAIDLGTSGPKVALVTTEGEVLASEVESTELFLSEGGGAEQDPDDWWRAIMTATRRITDRQSRAGGADHCGGGHLAMGRNRPRR